jgi:FkbM family methyltransferase
MGVIRTVVERLSRNRVIRRRLPADLGRGVIYVSPDSSLSYWRPRLQSDLFDFAREFVKPGDVVWDVGANVGLFCFAAARRAGPGGVVVALEPDVWLLGLLRRSAAASRGAETGRFVAVAAAASDALGIAEFNIARRGRSANFLANVAGQSQTGGVRDTVHTMTITLDWLLGHQPMPRVLKIDVEGAEVSVLRGATEVLRRGRPVVLCEVSEGNRAAVTELLRSYDYTLHDWDNRRAGPVETAAFNTLAIPA